MKLRRQWLRGGVTSSDGWAVNIWSGGSVRYRERKLLVFVGGEMLAPPHGWVLYPRDMRIGKEFRGPHLTDDTLRETIAARIKLAFEFLKIPLEVSW